MSADTRPSWSVRRDGRAPRPVDVRRRLPVVTDIPEPTPLEIARNQYNEAWRANTLTPELVNNVWTLFWQERFQRAGKPSDTIKIPEYVGSKKELAALKAQGRGIVILPNEIFPQFRGDVAGSVLLGELFPEIRVHLERPLGQIWGGSFQGIRDKVRNKVGTLFPEIPLDEGPLEERRVPLFINTHDGGGCFDVEIGEDKLPFVKNEEELSSALGDALQRGIHPQRIETHVVLLAFKKLLSGRFFSQEALLPGSIDIDYGLARHPQASEPLTKYAWAHGERQAVITSASFHEYSFGHAYRTEGRKRKKASTRAR